MIVFNKQITDYSFFSKLISKNKTCIPNDDSLLSFYNKNNKKILIIILDGFPNKLIYEKLLKTESKLHKHLNEISSLNVDSKTSVAYTYLSLPYIFGKISPERNCRFPFLGSNFQPNLILGSTYSGTNESLCSQLVEHRNSFVRFYLKPKELFSKSYQEELRLLKSKCTLENQAIADSIIDQISRVNVHSNRQYHVLHELKYHDDLEGHIKKLKYYDESYINTIKTLIYKLREKREVDEILILSDHGPKVSRFMSNSNYRLMSKSEIIEENSIVDNNIFGYFIYRIILSEKLKDKQQISNFKNLVPISNKRYVYDKFGVVTEIKLIYSK